MATIERRQPLAATPGIDQSRLSWRGEMLSVFFSAWALAGAFLDGWAHSKVAQFESFFTPYHAVFYTGFLAMTAWMFWTVQNNRREGYGGLAAIPRGYRLGLIGLIIFGAGTLADFLWHSGFGIEQAGERLSSPAHLVLFVGGLLAVMSPFRSAWEDSSQPSAPTLRAFLPALLSLALATTAASFFFLHVWGFHVADVLGAAQLDQLLGPLAARPDTARAVTVLAQTRVFGGIIITTLLLLGPMLVMLRRWHPPFGSVTILFGTTVLWMTALTEFRFVEAIPVALVAGLIADSLVRLLRPSPNRIGAFRVVATVVPMALWSLYFAATELRWDLAVSSELWVGGIFFTGVAGLGLSLAMIPAMDHDSAVAGLRGASRNTT